MSTMLIFSTLLHIGRSCRHIYFLCFLHCCVIFLVLAPFLCSLHCCIFFCHVYGISIALMFMTLRIFSYFCAEYHAYFLFLLNILCAFFTFWYICFSPLFPHFFFHLMVLPTTFPFLRFSFLYFEKAAFEICESIKSAGFNIHAVRE